MIGRGEKDFLSGGTGHDHLVAKGRHDLLVGGQGDDDLIAQGKGTFMVGGPGNNNYFLKDGGTDVVLITKDSATIYGFNPNEDFIIFAKIKKPFIAECKSQTQYNFF